MIKHCWHANCGEQVDNRDNSVYCSAHWKALTAHLRSVIHFIGDGATSLYVGRSNYPERRLLQHRASSDNQHDRLAVLHWAGMPAEAAEIERFIIDVVKTKYRLKGKNKSDESEGRWSGAWNALYVSWREKTGTKEIPVIWHEVDGLDGRPIAPVGGFLPFPLCLRTNLKPPQASAAVEARYASKPTKV